MSDPQRICLFGGSFDPIHLGHTYIAQAAVEALDLDLVLFLPCKQSPHKKNRTHASERHRLNMCRLATQDLPWAEVDDFDITAPAPSYSWRTAEAMHAKFPQAHLFWLMGTDQWEALPRWNRPDYFSELVDIIVFSRNTPPQARTGYKMHPILGHHPASSTEIRKAPHPDWLAPPVLEYIQANNLYPSSKSSLKD